jgi:hypothetical protein
MPPPPLPPAEGDGGGAGDAERSESGSLAVTAVLAERRFPLNLRRDATVGALRAAVVSAASAPPTPPTPPGASLAARLIFAGRILLDDGAKLGDVGLTDGAFVHVSLTTSGRGAPPPISAASAAAAAAAAGPFGGAAAFGVAADGGPAPVSPPVAAERRGFDRLAALGLADEEIAVLRTQFLPEVTRDFAALPRTSPDEPEASRLLRMEEAWLLSQRDDSDFALNLRPLLLARRAALGHALGVGGGGGDPRS